ncbi:MAG: UvrD-helicase domain-containing protein [Parcubacteria group bacterium]|nr:UvrD-helicase domain-containing protein [Parcubacteria group bacterium]
MSNILNDLNKEQQEAVQTVDGPVLIIAGAGSGKTKALTHRIAYLVEHGIKPENILALTFTNKAAEEMKNRVHKLLDPKLPTTNYSLPTTFLGTFHSFAAKILRREIRLLGYGPNFTIYDDADSFAAIKEIMAELAIDPDQFKPGGIKSAISKQKNELINAASYNASSNDFYAQTVSRVFARYETYLKEADALDFDDLLMLTVELFKKLPEVLEKYQNQFRYILVDEYQDTNRAQYILLKLLAQKYKNLCVVGDDWQSVYAFRGADFRNILTFEKDYPEAKIVFLEENYRSTQNILDAAHAVIQKNVYKTEKKLWTRRDRGEKIKIVQTADEIEEGMFITGEIKKILASESNAATDLNDFVVLYRTNAQSRAIEEAILQEGWSYRMVGAVKFYERREIKDVICYLRFIQNEKDVIGLKRIINTPPRGLGKSAWDKIVLYGLDGNLTQPKIKNFFDMIDELKRESGQKKLADFIKTVLEKTQYKNYCLDGTEEGEARWENVMELITVAAKFNQLEPPHGLAAFLEEITLAGASDEISEENGTINLMTLHSAKGLEFPVVFVAGAEEGLLPHAKSAWDNTQMEEERRLAYVGLTRAKEKVYLIFTRRRSIYGRSEASLPSRFLGDIPAHLVEYQEYDPLDEGEILNI